MKILRSLQIGWLVTVLSILTCSTAEAEEQVGEVLLLKVEGQVTAKRLGWSTPQIVQVGVVLRATDLLQVRPDAQVWVLCPNLESIWRVTSIKAGTSAGLRRGAAAGCPLAQSRTLNRGGRELMAARNAEDTERVLAPRGAIRSPAPLLRWQPLGSARSYEVQIVPGRAKNDAVWGPLLVVGLEQQYPDSPRVHALRPGESYYVQVRPYGSNLFVSSNVSFQLLDGSIRRRIDEGLEMLLTNLGEAIPYALAAGARLAADSVFGEAVEQLDSIHNDVDSAAVSLLGAHWTEALGLRSEAAARFGQARQKAVMEGSVFVETEALEGLARTERDSKRTRQLYQDASERWTLMGDTEAAERVRQALEALR